MDKYDKTKLVNLTSSSYFKEKQLPISRMKHHLGQNFLRNKEIASELATLSLANKNSLLLEIGTGAGDFTEALLKKGSRVISCEVDKDLFEYLENRFSEETNNKQLLLLFQDASKLNFEHIYKYYLSISSEKKVQSLLNFLDNNFDKKSFFDLRKEISEDVEKQIFNFTKELTGKVNNFRVCANLPYYLTRDFLYKMFVELHQAESFALMLQKEAAERLMTSVPKQQNYRRELYGPLAIFREFYGRANVVRKMKRSDFIPAPRVDSYFVIIEKENKKYDVNIKDISKLVFASFKQRRKTLLYNLNNMSLNGKILTREKLLSTFELLSFKQSIRAEELLPTDFINLYKQLK